MNATRTRKTSSKKTAAKGRGRADEAKSKSRKSAGTAASKRTAKGGASKGAAKGRTTKTSAAKGGARKAGGAKGSARNASAKRSTATKSRSPIGQAIEMLEQQHKEAQRLFRQGERAKDDRERLQQIVEQCCTALTEHAELEEQYFYPVMRENAKDGEMIAEALVEHESAKQLIEQLRGGDPGDERYAATYKVLSEYVKHHIKEEEKEIFPRARRMRADWEPLLDAIRADEARKEEGGASMQAGQAGTMTGEAGETRARGSADQGVLLGGSLLGQEGEQGEGAERPRRTGARRTSRGRAAEQAGEEAGADEGTARGREQDQDEQGARGTRSGSR